VGRAALAVPAIVEPHASMVRVLACPLPAHYTCSGRAEHRPEVRPPRAEHVIDGKRLTAHMDDHAVELLEQAYRIGGDVPQRARLYTKPAPAARGQPARHDERECPSRRVVLGDDLHRLAGTVHLPKQAGATLDLITDRPGAERS